MQPDLAISFSRARENVRDLSLFCRWNYAAERSNQNLARHRIASGIVRPRVEINGRFPSSNKFFAIGSCFAREIESALMERGLSIISAVSPRSPISFRNGGYTNRYNTMSMLNDIEVAFGIKKFDERSIIRTARDADQYIDLQSHPAGGYEDLTVTRNRRAHLLRLFERIKECQVIILTLGLTETWFDNETGLYTNIAPATRDVFDIYGERFEFHVTSYEQNFAALERIFDILRSRIGDTLRIVVTTSPVPLSATFSGRDVIVANMHSKSVLRACAETWARRHSRNIVYFPSFEMAMLSNPDKVWMDDRVHVRPDFVRIITDHFIASCIEGVRADVAMDNDHSIFVNGRDHYREGRYGPASVCMSEYLLATESKRAADISRRRLIASRTLAVSLGFMGELGAALDTVKSAKLARNRGLLAFASEHKDKIPAKYSGSIVSTIIGSGSPSRHNIAMTVAVHWGKSKDWYLANISDDERAKFTDWLSRK